MKFYMLALFINYKSSLQSDSDITKTVFKLISLLYENFDPFKHYGVNQFLGSLGLSVDRKYRGRGVGTQLLGARCVNIGIRNFF